MKGCLEAADRYAFAPVPYVAPGSRVRLSGDGPSCWVVYVMVARPKGKPWSSWGTLPGAYVLPKGEGERGLAAGQKPMWIMRQLVKDYSREGDLVVDPCAGGGSTLLAASEQGRVSVGAEVDAATYRQAEARIAARRRDQELVNGFLEVFQRQSDCR